MRRERTPHCKMYTRTCIPLAWLHEGISLLRRMHRDCARGRINPFATLHLPEKRPRESAWCLRASHVYTAWLELQNRIAKVARKKTEEKIYNTAAISQNKKYINVVGIFFFFKTWYKDCFNHRNAVKPIKNYLPCYKCFISSCIMFYDRRVYSNLSGNVDWRKDQFRLKL